MADRTVLIRYIVDVGQAVSGTHRLEQSQRRLAASTGSSMRTAGQSIATLGRLSALVGPALLVGVGGGLAVSAKAAIDFESSFAGVRKTLNASEGQFATLAQDMRDLAKEIPVNVNELNRLAEVGGQLGIDVENIESFTKTIAEIGVATPLAADQAALSLARLSNILGVAQEDIFRIGSSLVELGNNFATTEDQIINFALRIAPIGQTVGLTADQVLALGTAFSAVGVPAERGGTAVQRVFIAMEEAALSAGEELETFADIAGVSAEQFAMAYEEDAANAFRMFIEGLGEAQRAGRNVFDLLRDLGLGNERTFQALLASAGGAEQLARALDLSSEAFRDGGAASEEAEKRYNTTEGQIQTMQNALNDAAIAIGQSLTPAIEGLANTVTDFVNSPGFAKFLDFLTISLDTAPRVANGLRMLAAMLNQVGAAATRNALTFTGIDFLASEEGTPFGQGPVAKIFRDFEQSEAETQRLIKAVDYLRIALDRGTAPMDAAGNALAYLSEQGTLTAKAFQVVQREANLTDEEIQHVGEELWRLGAITKEQNAGVWWTIRNNMEELHTHSFPRMGRAARLAANELEILQTAAEQADEAIAMLGETELEGRDAARSFMESVRSLVDAQEAFADDASIENLFAVSEAWDAMRSSGLDLEAGMAPLISNFQELYKVGAISREEMERGIGEVLKFEQAAMLAAGSTTSFVTSVEVLGQVAEATGGNLQTTVLAIYGVNSAMLAGANAASIFAQSMAVAAGTMTYADVIGGGNLPGEISEIFKISGAVKTALEGIGSDWGGSVLDGIAGSASGGGGGSEAAEEVVKTFEELAIEASRKFIEGIRMTLNRSAMERALKGAKEGLEDTLSELDEIPARIRQTMRDLAEAQRDAQRITMEEQAGLLSGQLDIMRSERDLMDLRREQMDIPQQMLEIQQDLTAAQDSYNEALREAIRLERDHKAALTTKQADLFRVQRAYGLGQASFQDVIDAELDLASELARSGDAAEMREDAQMGLIDAQEQAAQSLEDLRFRQREIALELQLAEIELALSRKDLTRLMEEAVGPTEEVLELEEELQELRERAVELRKSVPELEDAIISAELDLISAHLDLIAAGEDLLAMEPRYRDFFESVAAAANLANGAFRSVTGVGGGSVAIPTTSGAGVPTLSSTSYTVQSGDWLSKIANKFGVTLGAVLTANPQITNPDLIHPGQQIKIPTAHQGAFFDLPRSKEFMAMLRGQEMVLDTRQLGAAVASAVRAAGGGGSTIVVQLGDKEVARFVADEVLAEGARQVRRARRVM